MVDLLVAPTVSLIVPTYNGSIFLSSALTSVFQQDRLPDEVIVVDDASEDDSVGLIEAIARTAPVPLRLIRLPKNSGGPARPLNVGVAAAHGDLITILEQDDTMRPRRIELTIGAFASRPKCNIVIGRVAINGTAAGDMNPIWPVPQFADVIDRDADDRPVITLDEKVAFSALLVRNFAATNSNLGFRKSLWHDIGGFNERVRTCTDLDYMLRATQTGPLTVINEVIVDYHWRANSLNRARLESTVVELTAVRLAAAAARPDWAGDHLGELQLAMIDLIKTTLARGELRTAFILLSQLVSTPDGFSAITGAAQRFCRRRFRGLVRDAR